MPIAFTKMHGLGNDYVYVDCFAQSLDGRDLPALARAVSDRHRGIGSDGLILIARPTAGVAADVRMEMYNADGSRSEMCGNGIRCVAKYALSRRLARPADGRTITVQSDAGFSEITVDRADAPTSNVRVNMGAPVLTPGDIPVTLPAGRAVRVPLDVAGERFSMTCVSMGNPHATIFVEQVAAIELARLGPQIERHPLFPNRVNAHFAQVVTPGEIIVRTWERGAGMTQACGSGACASAVAGILEGRLDPRVLTHLPGGDLLIEWEGGRSVVFMTGPAQEVFSGTWPD